MDKEISDKTVEDLSELEQSAATTSVSPPLPQNVEDLQSKQLVDMAKHELDELNTRSGLTNNSLKPLEIPDLEHKGDFIDHSVHPSMEHPSMLFCKEVGTLQSDLRKLDIAEKIVEIQPSELHSSSAPVSEEDKPIANIVNPLAVCHATDINSSLEETEADQIQSITSALSQDSYSPAGQGSSVSPDISSIDITKSLEEKKDSLTQHHLESAAEVFSLSSVNNTSISLCNPCHAATCSDLSTPTPETQLDVSCLEAHPPEKVTMPAAAACNVGRESVYYIKWVMFGQSNVPIVTQNENGPCPLLAIMNVLLLKEKVKLAPLLEMITSEQLMIYLGECIFENMPQNLTETTQANYEQNMQDAMSVMYKLQTGLDVNVKFTGVRDFEYTPELIIFDLLEISLYHGWLVDPQDVETVAAINQCSYNQLVEKIICLRQSQEEEKVRQALIVEQFLERTASQLTYHGLCELSSVIKEKELCVFFRNNHFNTLYKHNNELFILVTDQGFLTESSVVWETLSNVDGDCHFTDASFRTYTKPAPSTIPIPDPSVPFGSPEQIDHDYQVALFLQEEDASLQNQAWERSGIQQEQAAFAYADHEFAVRLQEEENRRVMGDHQRTKGTGVSETLSQQQSQDRFQGPSPEAQRRRADRGDRRDREEKSCSVL